MNKDISTQDSTKMAEGQNDQAMNILKIKIKFPSGKALPLDLTQNDTLVQIRQFLMESSELNIVSNFHFQYNHKPLIEFVELSSLELENDSTIHVVVDPFDEKSAKYHVKKVQEFLANPVLISSYLGEFSGTNPNNGFKPYTEKNKEKKVVENKDDGENTKNELTFEEVMQGSLHTYKEIKKSQVHNKKTNCLHSLCFSGFNPPPSFRRIKNDFFYLHARSLENFDFHITANSQGFFVNNSNQKNFDPSQNTNYPVFTSLFDLLKTVSAQFKKNFEQIASTEPIRSQLESFQLNKNLVNVNDWLESEQPRHEWDVYRGESSLVNLHGLDPTGIRDWNEELQICLDLPKSDSMDGMNRDMAISKVRNDFLDASIEGAKAVVEKNIQPLNPMDSKSQHVYVYNHIFFSFAVETPDSFKQEIGPDSSPTVSTANCDLRNLKILSNFNIPSLYLLNTALIDYKGYRIIAQSIIPGILNSDHNMCTQYGSLDDGNKIYTNPEFHELVKEVCNKFSLTNDVKLKDGEGNEVEIAGSVEIKGIKGSDRRNYLLDLMRLSPRDLNYPTKDTDQNLSCVLRHELIENFNLMKEVHVINAKYEPELRANAINYAVKPTEQKEIDERKAKEEALKKINTEKFMKIQELLSNRAENVPKTLFNPNIQTSVNLLNEERLEKETKDLNELAEFIHKTSIPNLISELDNGEVGKLADSRSIAEIFHNHGVNMRYLGQVVNKLSKDSVEVRIILERVILSKCLKHIIREYLRSCDQLHLTYVIAHIFNCLFSSNTEKKLLDEKKVILNLDTTQSVNDNKNKKKSKKNKKKDANGEAASAAVFIPQSNNSKEAPEFFSLTPSALWAKVQNIATKRYQYELPNEYQNYKGLNLRFNKVALLRDVCVTIGIKIESKNYGLTLKKSDVELLEINYCDLPFNHNNIIDLQPVIKKQESKNVEIKNLLDIAQKILSEGKINEGLEYLISTIHHLINLYGPVSHDVAACYSKIATVYYKIGEFNHAIFYQKQAFLTFERYHGLDHYQTAHALSTLSLFHLGAKNYNKSTKLMLRALYLMTMIGGEAYPDTFMTFMNLALIYQENKQYQSALTCLFEALERNKELFGENHLKVAGCYQAIAITHFEIDDLKKAIEYQEKYLSILKQNMKSDDLRVREAEEYLLNFNKIIQEKKKNQTIREDGSKRAFGTNKVIKPAGNQPLDNKQEASKERELLLRKVKIAKMHAKNGNKRVPYVNEWDRMFTGGNQQPVQMPVNNEQPAKTE